MSDGKQNSGEPGRQEPQPRNPRDDFRDQLKRIRDEAVGDLKKSLGMPKEDGERSRRDGVPFSQGRPPSRLPSLSGRMGEELSARASETARPGAPGKERIRVSGEVIIQHRQKRTDPTYAPTGDAEELMDAKDAGQYHVAATAGGGRESANGAMGLDGIRKIYYELGQQAANAGDPKEEVSRYYPRADPSQVEKGMVDQTRTGIRILKDAFKDGYTKRNLKPTSEMLREQQDQKKGPTARPSGIVGGLLNRLRGSSCPGPTITTVAGVRGSETELPQAACARKLLHDGYLHDGDIGTILSLLDSNDPGVAERLGKVLAKYRAEGIGFD